MADQLGFYTFRSCGMMLARLHMYDWISLLLLAGIDGLLNIIEPFHRFVGKDMITDLRYPMKGNTVPFWAVPLIGIILPWSIFVGIYFIRKNFYDLHHGILGILYSVLITAVITDAIKDGVGWPRPDFFWRCFPDGNDVYDNITAGVICNGVKSVIKEGHKSFPCGHTSWSFAGLGFLAWYLAGKIRTYDRRGRIVKLCIVFLPLLTSALVAVSRVDDYCNHWLDVFAGGLIGLIVASFCYLQFFPYPFDGDALLAHAYMVRLAEEGNRLEIDEKLIHQNQIELCPSAPRPYSHRELAAATNGFTEAEKIGRGGFGPVYRGFFADQARHVAIKVLSSSVQPQGMREFQAEVKVMTRLRHRNIIQLLGWSGEAGGLMLVYELVPNGSLDKHLHDPQGPLLAWTDRYKIALGVGSAILYLHTECEQCVLHGDIKPANILLDASCNAKLGDFGLARLVDHGTDSRTTQVVAGTPGYMDPEFVNNGRPSAEADVFSFGVVLLELASARRPAAAAQPNATSVLVNWVRDMYHKDTVLGAADRRLDGEFDHQQMRRVLVTGLWCTHHDQSQRPTIAQAMDLLRRQDAELPILTEMHGSATTASVRYLEEIAYGDLDLSAEDSVFEDSSADTAYHTSEDSTCLLQCLEKNGTSS